jgi:hypothetical protein
MEDNNFVMDIRVDRKQFKDYTKKNGFAKTLEYCKKKYPELDLYEISKEWYTDRCGLACLVFGKVEQLNIYWTEYDKENLEA